MVVNPTQIILRRAQIKTSGQSAEVVVKSAGEQVNRLVHVPFHNEGVELIERFHAFGLLYAPHLAPIEVDIILGGVDVQMDVDGQNGVESHASERVVELVNVAFHLVDGERLYIGQQHSKFVTVAASVVVYPLQDLLRCPFV